ARCASGTRTCRLEATRIRRSRSALRASSDKRSSRSSRTRRAVRKPAVCLVVMATSTHSMITSQITIQWRPLRRIGYSEDSELGAPGTGVLRHFRSAWQDRLTRFDSSKRSTSTGADRLARRADTVARPFPKRLLHETVLAGMIGDDGEPTSRHKRIAKGWKSLFEPGELIVHLDSHRLEESGKVRRSCPWAQHCSNRIDQVVTDSEGL